MVAILGQACFWFFAPSSISVDLISALVICFVSLLQALQVCWWIIMPMSFWWNLEAFTCTFGLISSMICYGLEARSRSNGEDQEELPVREWMMSLAWTSQ